MPTTPAHDYAALVLAYEALVAENNALRAENARLARDFDDVLMVAAAHLNESDGLGIVCLPADYIEQSEKVWIDYGCIEPIEEAIERRVAAWRLLPALRLLPARNNEA
jgi:hypothetical protein